MKENYIRFLVIPFVFCLVLTLSTKHGFAQCAGQDGTMVICDSSDPTYQNFDLFSVLGGTPDAGGTWSDDDGAFIFVGDPASGIINLWGLNSGGLFHFTYTVDDPGCSDNSATVTLTVGGYAGVDNLTANACEDDSAVNLFQFIGSNPNPHLYGQWSDDSNTGNLYDNFFDAVAQGPGVYMFIYSVPAVGPCEAQEAVVQLTVNELPNPGDPSSIEICGLEELADYTNVDLENYLSGGEPHGIWSEGSSTNELTGPNDTTVNVQNIFDNSGYGIYAFTYTVAADHPVCQPASASINIKIRRIIDFDGTNLSVDSLCEDEVEDTDLILDFEDIPGLDAVPGYTYVVEYQINGPVNFADEVELTLANPFIVLDGFTPTPGSYTITITDITTLIDTDDVVCDIQWDLSTDFDIWELPDLDNAQLDVPDICQGENATATITNADNLDDGSYTITYEISGANIGSGTASISVQNATANFDLASADLSNVGTTTVLITSISDDFCDNEADLETTFEVNPLPDPDAFTITIENACLGDPISVSLGNLIDLDYFELTYSISGANTSANQTIDLTATNNTATFDIPANLLPSAGTTTFHIDHVVNLDTGCEQDGTLTEDFEIYPLPEAPEAGPQEFCESEEPEISALVPNGSDYFWYENETDGTPLSKNTIVASGTYWLAQRDEKGCFSEKTPVSITVHHVPLVTLISGGQDFCGANHPSIADLSANTDQNNSYDILWFDGDGNQLDEDAPLVDGMVYYGFTSDPITNCESSQGLEVTVNLTDCGSDDDDLADYDFFIPDAFSPNGDGINDTFRIKDIDYVFPDYQFEIYNRYGKLLFKGDIKHPEWNGETSEGETLSDGIAPNGVYFYIIKFNKDNKSPQQGRLYLNR